MIELNTHPDRYHHWKLSFDGPVARLAMAVDPGHPFGEGYELKLNSYDLGVDIELQDAVQRLRFEHPEVQVVIVTGGYDRVFWNQGKHLFSRRPVSWVNPPVQIFARSDRISDTMTLSPPEPESARLHAGAALSRASINAVVMILMCVSSSKPRRPAPRDRPRD